MPHLASWLFIKSTLTAPSTEFGVRRGAKLDISRLKQKCGVSRVAFFYLKRGHGEITGESHLRHQPDRSCRQCRSIPNEGIWPPPGVRSKNPPCANSNTPCWPNPP